MADLTIIKRFRTIANASPTAIAVVDLDGTTTYGELARQVTVLRIAIQKAVPDRGIIAALLPNSAISLVAALACLEASRTCILLDADHPAERLSSILHRAGANVVLGRSKDLITGIFPPGTIQLDIASLEKPSEETFEASGVMLDAETEAAFVIYTSGSTGLPKGIALSELIMRHRALHNIDIFRMGPVDHVLSLNALGTIAGLATALTALLAGSRQYILPIPTMGAGALLEWIGRERINQIWSVPSVLAMLSALDGASAAFGALRLMRLAGEPIKRDDFARFQASVPPSCELYITYGQTEVPKIAGWSVPHDFEPGGLTLPSGYILDEHAYTVVDEHGTEVGAGAPGELIIRSRFTSLGEWEAGRVTPGRASSNSDDASTRTFPTGDIVEVDPRGRLQILGRADQQIKVNGHRVEPQEVEAALKRVEGVSDAVVVVQRDGDRAKLIAGVVPSAPGNAAVANRCRAAARRLLPSHMQPSQCFALDAVPHLPSGKIDRQAVLDKAQLAVQAEALHEHERSTLFNQRHAVRWAWERVGGLSRFDDDRTFSNSGGDSLKLLEFVHYLENRLGKKFPLAAFHLDLRPSQIEMVVVKADEVDAVDMSPVFLVPGGAGHDGFGLANLRRWCHPRVQFALLETPADWNQWLSLAPDLDLFLEYFLKQVTELQPQGTIRLVGYSLGGALAYRLALDLERRGRTIAFLGLIDPVWSPAKIRHEKAYPSLSFLGRVWYLVNNISKKNSFGSVTRKIIRFIGIRLMRHISTNPRLLRRLTNYKILPIPRFSRFIQMQLLFSQWFNWCLSANNEPVMRANACLFLSYARDHASDPRWNEHFIKLDIAQVSGDHLSMLEDPHASHLANLLVDAINAASG